MKTLQIQSFKSKSQELFRIDLKHFNRADIYQTEDQKMKWMLQILDRNEQVRLFQNLSFKKIQQINNI